MRLAWLRCDVVRVSYHVLLVWYDVVLGRYDNSDSDSDVDGRPLDEDNSRGKQRDPALSDSDDDGGMKIDIFGGAEESSTGSGRESGPKWSESEEEERRTMLRTLETKLLLLRDDMEAKHVPPDEIEERISQKRNETVQTWERVSA